MIDRDERTFAAAQESEYERNHPPKCRSHHTYVTTVPIPEAGVWVCPSCGAFSDTDESYTGGRGLTKPTDIDPEAFITVEGRVLIRGDVGVFPTDYGMDAALLDSSYAAKDAIKSFDGWRRWKPDYGAWAVPYRELPQVADTLQKHGYQLLNVHEIVTQGRAAEEGSE